MEEKQNDVLPKLDGCIETTTQFDLDMLRCVVCMVPFVSATSGYCMECNNKQTVSHLVCNVCSEKCNNVCPVCKSVGFNRNNTLRRLLTTISEECSNFSRGCRERFYKCDPESKKK